MESTPSVRPKPKPTAHRQPARRRQVKEIDDRPVPPFIHLVRLIICGMGATTIAGTTISVLNPPTPLVKTKGKLPNPPTGKIPIPGAPISPNTKVSIPGKPAPLNSPNSKLPTPVKPTPINSPKLVGTPPPQQPSVATPPKKNSKLDVKPNPDNTDAAGFPKSEFIKPASIRP